MEEKSLVKPSDMDKIVDKKDLLSSTLINVTSNPKCWNCGYILDKDKVIDRIGDFKLSKKGLSYNTIDGMCPNCESNLSIKHYNILYKVNDDYVTLKPKCPNCHTALDVREIDKILNDINVDKDKENGKLYSTVKGDCFNCGIKLNIKIYDSTLFSVNINRNTLKSFIKNNMEHGVYVANLSDYEEDIDSVIPNDDPEVLKVYDYNEQDQNSFGIDGIWLVSGSRNSFTRYENEKYLGIKVYNCCGNFIVFVKK